MSKRSDPAAFARATGAGDSATATESRTPIAEFDPVPVRPRHDGWSAEKQTDFIEALAECGCVDHACQRVGMSVRSAYTLRLREDARSFRLAWEVALEYAVQRLSDAVLSRAIHGVSRPVFFQGQQIGERRYFDERLAMFILRYRDAPRFGRWLDQVESSRPPDALAARLAHELDHVADDAVAEELGEPPTPRRFEPLERVVPVEETVRELVDALRRAREGKTPESQGKPQGT